jgi:16S rRNA C967 or C1407 C5-methylase (RsmB/RsmF family)/NOL1/NOP2/fmu family ribosome biogenesis protein
MRQLLGEAEYEQFVQSYNDQAQTGLRVNTLKISVADFIRKSPFTLSSPLPYEPAGFLVMDDSQPGKHPYHAAGLYYLQEPSAMVVASLMRPQPGEWVLDISAAPGGKSTHLAALMTDAGLLLANDINRGRVWYLVQNLERWGSRQSIITNNSPEELVAALGPIFDKVLLDAPCSGEGMFRRKGGFEWSPEMVNACGRRQQEILQTAAQLVCPGGLLSYATCTFSPEENEEVIGRFLDTHPGFELVKPAQHPGFSAGQPAWVTAGAVSASSLSQLQHAVRLFPHHIAGEGHFIALLRRPGTKEPSAAPGYQRLPTLPPTAIQLWRQFAEEVLQTDLPEEQLWLVNQKLFLRPRHDLEDESLRVVRHGLWLGEVRRGYFRPAHTLALALASHEVQQTLNWAAASENTAAYLSGQSIPSSGADGWVLVTVDGFSLGWAKRVNGRLQNHYPRGLRQP